MTNSVTIAIPTFHRPTELARLLSALESQLADTAALECLGVTCRVLVIDNDPAGGAEATVAEAPAGLPVRYVREPTAGLAAVRNRAIDESADDRLLIFLDDDESPDTGWFEAMIGFWNEQRPAGVLGKVVSVFSIERDPWLVGARAFLRPSHRTGDRLHAAATNNLLLDLHVVRRERLRFDPRMGMSGGEDSLFTQQLVRSGGALLWCDEAVVLDHIPADRLRRDWVLKRAFRGGTVAVAVDRHLDPGTVAALLTRGRYALGGAGRLLVGTARRTWGALRGDDSHRARGERGIARGAGMIAGAFGYTYQEYAKRSNRADASAH